ncbi:MAG: hypothetical protein COA58_06475 [Bacteroidetes bacterium]|nr:MAG: hypothetical protein COA58_06475 [Bacteroidota bacterium]
MKNIKLFSMFALLSVGALFLTNCSGTDETPEPSPILNFLGGSEFVDDDISLAANTSFSIAITASHDKNIKSLKITAAINGGVEGEVFDSSFSDKTITQYVYNGVTGTNAGSEVYTVIIADKDGNSTSKSITITNLGDPGNSLVEFLLNNDDETFKVWNFRGAKKGAYGITTGINISSGEPDADKDIQDSTKIGETSGWPARWTSRNGTEFRKVTGSSWSNITNDSELLAAWEAVGTSETTVDIVDGDLYVLNLGNGGAYALVEITDVVTTSGDNNDYVQFRYKKQL